VLLYQYKQRKTTKKAEHDFVCLFVNICFLFFLALILKLICIGYDGCLLNSISSPSLTVHHPTMKASFLTSLASQSLSASFSDAFTSPTDIANTKIVCIGYDNWSISSPFQPRFLVHLFPLFRWFPTSQIFSSFISEKCTPSSSVLIR
jgi:hypothetical protein